MLDSWIADLPLSQWLTFISTEISDSMRIFDLLFPDRKRWNLMVVTRVFGNILGMRVLSIALRIHTSRDVKFGDPLAF